MRTSRENRSKILAGVGVLAMLMGVVLVLAPGAGAHHEDPPLDQTLTTYNTNVHCGQPSEGNVIGLGYDDFVHFGTALSGSDDGVSFTTTVVNGVMHFAWESEDHDVEAIVVKQASGSAVFTDLPSPSEGIVWVATGSDRTTFSHIDFCFNTQPRLKVEKVVSGTAPSNAVYQIDVTKDSTLIADNRAISPTSPYTTTGAGTYDITEVSTGGASSVSWACFEGNSTTPTTGNTTSITGVVVDDEDVRCVFTNTFTSIIIINTTTTTLPPTGAIQIVKAVSGDAPDEWSYGFTGDLGTFTLTNVSPSNTEIDLDPGQYTITETPDDIATLESIVCEGATGAVDLIAGSVTVTLTDDASAKCTFTNDYPEVEPSVVTRPTTTIAPTIDTTPEVLPEVVVRPTTLPRTGDEGRKLLGLGLLLLGAGSVLVARGGVIRERSI